jgi:CDP-diacylglycerol--glycerol-3-phosphate 3-phosphatidyltransferase
MSAVPNILTALRLIAVPIMVMLYAADEGREGQLRWLALAVFVAAAATDLLDGYLARRWEVVTAFGKIADPIADKVLVLGAFAMLANGGELPWWPVVILAVREVGVTLGRLAVVTGSVIAASRGGKLKTVMQNASIFAFLLPLMPAWVDTMAFWLLLGAVAVAVVTGVDYGIKIARAAALRRAAGARLRDEQPHGDRTHDQQLPKETLP